MNMNTEKPVDPNDQSPARNIYSFILLFTIGAVLIITAIIFYPETREQIKNRPTLQLSVDQKTEIAPAAIETPTPYRPIQATGTLEPSPTPIIYTHQSQFGILVLSIREGAAVHIFAYQPFLEDTLNGDYAALPLTRLTDGEHQNIDPDINSEGTKIAFSSNRSGQWDIYILDLITGETERFTDSRAYDGNPTWSPDGQWLAYESYNQNNLDIFLKDIEGKVGTIPLTNHPAADHSPTWSREGRKIGFISTRSGNQEVWYADLDSSQQDKAVRIKNLPGIHIQHPSWSSDGRYLTWSILTEEGFHSLVSWDSLHPNQDPVLLGTGDRPQWAGSGKLLYTLVEDPHHTYLTAYPINQENQVVMLPALKLPGSSQGISWAPAIVLPDSLEDITGIGITPLWEKVPELDDPKQIELVQLRSLEATFPYFHPDAAESFRMLRKKTENLLGWDFLATVENAYLPLSSPAHPRINLDWLYTGRGLMINDIPRLANWIVVVKENFGSETYWRVYVRTIKQQGSQGMPLKVLPWDFNARYSGSNLFYENGGTISKKIPEGYWIDFTELAQAYGWLRFPAQSYWQFSESASRYQYYAFTQGISLEYALSEIYSSEEIQDWKGSANP
jgi:TolB protein